MSLVKDEVDPKVIGLCKLLKKGALPIKKLGLEFSDEETLGSAFAAGFIQVGRQMYSEVMDGEGIVKKENGKPVLDEQRRQVIDKKFKYQPDNEWSWLDSSMQGRKPLNEVLQEDSPKGIDLHARLTSAGLAATA